MVESCCEAANNQWKQGLGEQRGAAQFEGSAPRALRIITKVGAPWSDIRKLQLCGRVALYRLFNGLLTDVSSSTAGKNQAGVFHLVLSLR